MFLYMIWINAHGPYEVECFKAGVVSPSELTMLSSDRARSSTSVSIAFFTRSISRYTCRHGADH